MIRVQTNRGLDGKFKKVSDMLDGYRDRYLELMSAQLVLESPVDTGTYITEHNLGTSPVTPSASSDGKPTKQPYEPFAQDGFKKLLSDLKGLPKEAIRAVFSNASFHKDEVEYEHGYLVYTKAAREHGRIAKQAAEDVKNG